MNKVQPILFWELSCAMFCKCFQQYRPSCVPIYCAVRVSFILVVMTHHCRNHFGDCYCQVSPSGERAWIAFHFLSFVEMVLFVYMDSSVGGMLRVIEEVSLLLLLLETRIKPVSWMLVSVCSSQDSLPSDLWRSVRTASGIWTSSTNRLFPLEITT